MKKLKDLVVGDKVVTYDKYDNRRIAIVERITKTLVVVNNIKYRKSNGFASGESYIFSRRIEIPKDEEQIKVKALPVKIGDKIIDEEGRVGWLSRIVPYHSPSERFMRATLNLTLFFHIEKKDGTRDNREVYVNGLPIKL